MRGGWEQKKISELCEVLDTLRRPITKRNRKSGNIPYYGATGIVDYVSEWIFNEKLVLLGEDGAKWKSGDPCAFIIDGQTWVNNHAHVLRPNRNLIIDEWLVYYLNYSDLSPYISGMTVPKLNQNKMTNILIPIPDLFQQKKIVAFLDEAFAAIDKVKENAEKNLKNVKELFESCVNTTFLVKDSWITEKLKIITSKIGSGATPPGGERSYKKTGISLIRSLNVHDHEFRLKDLAFIDNEQANKLANVTVQECDVLFNITGASVARCCIVLNNILPARVNQHVSIVRAKKDIILPQLLQLALSASTNKNRLLKIGESGATRQAITKAQLEEFEISFPKHKTEQENIITKIDQYHKKIIELKTAYSKKLKDLDELKKSILKKAFNGDLNISKQMEAV